MPYNLSDIPLQILSMHYRQTIPELINLPVPKEYLNGYWNSESITNLHVQLKSYVNANQLTIQDVQLIEERLFLEDFSKQKLNSSRGHLINYVFVKTNESIQNYMQSTILRNRNIKEIGIANGCNNCVLELNKFDVEMHWIETKTLDRVRYDVIFIPQKITLTSHVKNLLRLSNNIEKEEV